jgi:TonB family protein
MKSQLISGLALGLLASATACGTARDVDAYRSDTQKLLDSRSSQLQSCYDDALKSNRKLSGTVTVQFVVEKESGQVVKATIDTAKSTAPPALGQCVLRVVEGLKLEPPDKNEGQATFVYEFKPSA